MTGQRRDIQGMADLLIAVALGKLVQDLCAGDHVSTVHTFVNECKEVFLLVIAELDAVRWCDSWQGSLQMELGNITHKLAKENQ